jgi:hypothetical protein
MSKIPAWIALLALIGCSSQESERVAPPIASEPTVAPADQNPPPPVAEPVRPSDPEPKPLADEAPETPPRSPAPSAPEPKPAAAAEARPEASVPSAESALPRPPAVDLDQLTKRLKDTPAIGVFTKLELKRQIDELVSKARASHAKGVPKLDAVRERFNGLVMKLLALLEDDEPSLAAEVAASRDSLWAMLADPNQVARL